ncbi:MAG: DUF935 family protein [Kofleriaceae bacterium]
MSFFDAIKPSAIATALRLPKKPPSKSPTVAEGFVAPSSHEQLVQYLAESADHRNWFSAMRAADLGDTRNQTDLFLDAQVRDPRLRGLASKRVTAMMGRPIVFKPPPGFEHDKDALESAALVTRALLVESRGFRSKLQHLSSATVLGPTAIEKVWTQNANGEWIPHLVDRRSHANRFGYHRDKLEIGFYRNGRNGWDIVPLSEYPDSFVWHEPMAGLADYPWRRGAMRSCIVPSFIKRNGLKYWLTLAERFGMPQVYAKTPFGTDDDGENSSSTIGKIKASLASLGRYWYAVFGNDITIEKIEGSGEADAEVHSALIEWANLEMAIALLGQNLTTEVTGGSFAASETHRWVADDIFITDAVELAETITQQLAEPIIRFSRPGSPVPICEINTGRKQTFTVEDLVNGVCTQNELRHTKGHPAKPEGTGGDEYLPVGTQRPKVAGAPTGPKPAQPKEDGPRDESSDEDASRPRAA